MSDSFTPVRRKHDFHGCGLKTRTELLVDSLLHVVDVLLDILELPSIRTLALESASAQPRTVACVLSTYVCLQYLDVTVVKS